ncbi:MAG: response regulator transcription factor [Cyanobacteriota bacterium]|nr:response regulator transcription factor [Cyanobacteriota bacterium]
MIRVLLADDQSLVREGLSSLLDAQPDIEVVGEAENGKMAVERARSLHPDVVLMDVRMPVMDGVAAAQAISQQAPNVKVLILTTFDDDDYVTRAIAFGAKGYLLKDTPSEVLAQAIRLVDRGYTQLGPGVLEKLMTAESHSTPEPPSELAQLTPREQEVLHLIGKGYSNREIAEALYISERTVKNHVNSLLRRLNLRDRTQAAILATTFNNQS